MHCANFMKPLIKQKSSITGKIEILLDCIIFNANESSTIDHVIFEGLSAPKISSLNIIKLTN